MRFTAAVLTTMPAAEGAEPEVPSAMAPPAVRATQPAKALAQGAVMAAAPPAATPTSTTGLLVATMPEAPAVEPPETRQLAQAAQAAGVALNPGPEWSTDKEYARCRLRLCFANPEPETIRKGVEVLADVCRREFGVPLRSANIDKR